MAIRKFGTEPAKVETRAEDNDAETLGQVRKQAQEGAANQKPERMVYPIEPDWHE